MSSRSARRVENIQLDDLVKVLDHGPGRRILRAIIDASGVYDNAAAGAGESYFLGRRSVGLGLIRAINGADPVAYAKLMTEAANEVVTAEVRQNKREQDSDVE